SAWATRFLNAMFARFCVLFVGYSHQDPVMRYLARAYGAATQRFVMTREDRNDLDYWDFLGIQPVIFPVRPLPDGHGALVDALTAWGEQSRMGALEHERRIQGIVATIPPLEPDLADYIASALGSVPLLRFLVKHARDETWLKWAEEKGAFANLLNGSATAAPADSILAAWFAERFVVANAQAGLDFVARHDLEISAELWHAIGRELFNKARAASPDVLHRWIAVMCQTISPHWGAHWLNQLLTQVV